MAVNHQIDMYMCLFVQVVGLKDKLIQIFSFACSRECTNENGFVGTVYSNEILNCPVELENFSHDLMCI
jgi:hypothetical protein